eukprot:scaffold350_cov333-Pavlova_lutheri.AAC.15
MADTGFSVKRVPSGSCSEETPVPMRCFKVRKTGNETVPIDRHHVYPHRWTHGQKDVRRPCQPPSLYQEAPEHGFHPHVFLASNPTGCCKFE